MKIKNEIKLTEDGVITEPNVHDAELVGILFPTEKQALLLIKDTHNLLHCIALNGVKYLRSDGIREGNIILDITVESGKDVNPKDISYLLGLNDGRNYENLLLQTLERVKDRELLLLKLNPSYGGSLICLCDGIAIESTWITVFESTTVDEHEPPI